MKTIIQTRIEGDRFVATTPHVPDLSAEDVSETRAINGLIAAVRQHTKQRPVPWICEPEAASGKDIITRKLSGLWPVETKEPEPASPAMIEREDDGD